MILRHKVGEVVGDMSSSGFYKVKDFISRNLETILIVGTMIAVLFLLGGGLYDLTERPLWFIVLRAPGGVTYRFYWPGGIMTMQTLSESILAMIAYGGAIAGLLTVYRGLRRVYEPRYSTALVLIGGTVALVSLTIVWLIIASKM